MFAAAVAFASVEAVGVVGSVKEYSGVVVRLTLDSCSGVEERLAYGCDCSAVDS